MTVYYDQQSGTQSEQPVFFDNQTLRIPNKEIQKRNIQPSKMFLIKEELKVFAKNNPKEMLYDASQGDGGASLGGIPKEELAAALLSYLPPTGSTKYGNPIGREDVRQAIVQNYYGFSNVVPEQVIMGDGGRDLLQKWYQLVVQGVGSIGGSVIVSAAPWGSYMQGTYMNGLNTILAPGNAEQGFCLTKDGVDSAMAHAKEQGHPAVALVITSPDNPTGNYLAVEHIRSLIQHAVDKGIAYVLVDLMYQAVTDPEVGMYDVAGLLQSLSSKEQNCVFFLDGLTKSVGGSNVRSCHLVCGSIGHSSLLKGLATHSVLPNALGEAASLEVYRHESPILHPWVQKVVVPTAQSRAYLRSALPQKGFHFIMGQGYYAFINIWPWIGTRLPEGEGIIDPIDGSQTDEIKTVAHLKSYLAQKMGLAVIHGSVFRQPDFIRFSYANTPSYVQGALERLEKGLHRLR
ncbi:MAG: hypothetical protein CL916_03365 [Deltaproteobacteria bacterium]|nr:hypothetical protein [Deltaproteobacteria bacterium]